MVFVCCAAIKVLFELVLDADPLSNWFSCPVLKVFLSNVQDSNDDVKLTLIDSLNVFWNSGSGINVGMYRYKIKLVIFLSTPINFQ